MQLKPSKKLIYLDHAATTPVREEVLRAMKPFWAEKFGNPSSLYKAGVEAKTALENARRSVADNLSARSEEIVFTAGGSESVSLGILGVARAWRVKQPLPNPPLTRGGKKHQPLSSLSLTRGGKNHQPLPNLILTKGGDDEQPLPNPPLKRGGDIQTLGNFDLARRGGQRRGHVITSQIEHAAVLEAVAELEKEGFAVSRIGVDKEGFFNLDEFKKAIRPDTFLVSLMYANNEVGSVQSIREIASVLRKVNTQRTLLKTENYQLKTPILFHTDACQAAGFFSLNVQRLGVDLMSINASKIYGPKGVGALFVRKGVEIAPLIYGGGQERNLRSGTENVPGVVGFAKALELAQQERVAESKRLTSLSDYFVKQVFKRFPGVSLNGPSTSRTTSPLTPLLKRRGASEEIKRLPNNINLTFPDCEGEALMLYLDSYNIAVSTGSACTSGETDPSHVLLAMGKSARDAKNSIRLTLGKSTTKQQLDYVLKVLKEVVGVLTRTFSSMN